MLDKLRHRLEKAQKVTRKILLGILGICIVFFLLFKIVPGFQDKFILQIVAGGVEGAIFSGDRYFCEEALDSIKKMSVSEKENYADFFRTNLSLGVDSIQLKQLRFSFFQYYDSQMGIDPRLCFAKGIQAMGSVLYPFIGEQIGKGEASIFQYFEVDFLTDFASSSPQNLEYLAIAVSSSTLPDRAAHKFVGMRNDLAEQVFYKSAILRIEKGQSLSADARGDIQKLTNIAGRMRVYPKKIVELAQNSKISNADRTHLFQILTSRFRQYNKQIIADLKPYIDEKNQPDLYSSMNMFPRVTNFKNQKELDRQISNLLERVEKLGDLQERKVWTSFLKLVQDIGRLATMVAPRQNDFNTDRLHGLYYNVFSRIEKSGLLKYGIGYQGPYSKLASSLSKLKLIQKFEEYFLSKGLAHKNQRSVFSFLLPSEKVSSVTKKKILEYLRKMPDEERFQALHSVNILGKDAVLEDQILVDIFRLMGRESFGFFSSNLKKFSAHHKDEMGRYIIFFNSELSKPLSPEDRILVLSLLSTLKRNQGDTDALGTALASVDQCSPWFPAFSYGFLSTIDGTIKKGMPGAEKREKIFSTFLLCPLQKLKKHYVPQVVAQYDGYKKIVKSQIKNEKDQEKITFLKQLLEQRGGSILFGSQDQYFDRRRGSASLANESVL